MRKKRKLAVFDIDGTIFRSSLLIEVVEEMIARDIFPVSARKQYQKAKENWQNRRGEYEDYILGVVRAFERNTRGIRFSDFERSARAVIAASKDRVYRYTRDLARELKRKNYYLLAISHSPKYIVHDFALKLGFNKTYGRILEWDKNKKLTGRTHYEDLIMDKEKILKRAIDKEGLTLRGSVGVGDTDSDISFLELVDNPICFNPNSGLYRIARRRGWKIVIERKDVIYQLK
ncbi:MAG: HAD-IB family phosphatase [Candidatus Liptonbacteria bacterium]